jgi:ABC-type nitrate/sulfonate/bicarbonate transport system substrate-binding protein
MSTHGNGGIGVTDKKIKNNPAEILAFVRGTIKALRYSFQNRSEVIKIRPGYLGIKDAALVDLLYDLYLTRQSVDGSVNDHWMKGAIEFTQKTLTGAVKEVPPSQVFDFSFVQKAAR